MILPIGKAGDRPIIHFVRAGKIDSLTSFLDTKNALGARGYALRLEYDVDSTQTAYNGFWMKFNNFDATAYDILSFYVTSDPKTGFTSKLKVELKNALESSSYVLSGITDTWRRVEIPLEKFYRIQDWSSMREFVLVFEDRISQPKTGSLYIDNIAFQKA